MSFWRKLSLVGVVLSIIQGVVGWADHDGAGETAAEVAMLAAVFGPGEKPRDAGREPSETDTLIFSLTH